MGALFPFLQNRTDLNRSEAEPFLRGETMNNSNAKSRIHRMCAAGNFNEDELYEKAKLLLESYRDVCWTTVDFVSEVREECELYEKEYYCSSDMETALIYLETFAPEEGKDRFEEKVHSLFETKWMVEIVDSAMVKVKECPINGELYFSMLSAYYLNKFEYTEREMLDEFNMERSTYYRRKKEAVIIFGLAVWGSSIKDLRDELAI